MEKNMFGKNSKAEKFNALLRKSGFKATRSRLSVLEILGKARNPMSAHDVIKIMGKKADQATVYRIFKTLKEKGIIRQIDLRHNHAHYEISGSDEHHHLICIHCGKIEDVRDCGIDDTYAVILRRSKHFSDIKQHALEFYGVCKSCGKRTG